MSILEHFAAQHVDTRGDKENLLVMTDVKGQLAVLSVPKDELETLLATTTFDHMAGNIPRFNKPRIKGKWKNPLKKEDGEDGQS
jgi:hypothetical protein